MCTAGKAAAVYWAAAVDEAALQLRRTCLSLELGWVTVYGA